MDLGVVTDVDRQGALEDDAAHHLRARIHPGDAAQLRLEAFAGLARLRMGARLGFHHEGGNLPGGLAEPYERAARDVRMLAEGRLQALRREVRREFTVLEVSPGHMETGFADRALAGEPPTIRP